MPPTASNLALPSEFVAMLAEDGHENPPAYQFYLDQLINPTLIPGANVLEVGSGRGLLSLYFGLRGAKEVFSLEPELQGARPGSVELQRTRRSQLGLSQLRIMPVDFDSAELPTRSFDLIIMNAVLNHLHETPLPLRNDQVARERFLELACRMGALLRPGGTAIVTDACRYSFWTQARRFGLPSSLCYSRLRTIDWRLHQQPRTWVSIFRQAGFASGVIEYPVPYRLRHLATLLNTGIAAWCLQGEFILRLTK